eukprot:TRINITY_DN4100_c0_g1_i1.p2 TRINITY_DN4100_c0_g1~~TRINITY_DN4100_c0_g1_i1.p2  ORF type:complete len:141 (-),score=40.19 TRINITY_DN4100_c0_g1_i1:97-519(-)
MSTTLKDVDSAKFIAAYAAHLKRSNWLKLPAWVDLVKTATFKEMPPMNEDWYYVRAAALARKIYLRGGVGIGYYRHVFGGPTRRGVRGNHHTKASGAIIRHVIKQLESIGVVEKDPKGGRRITTEGQRDIDRIAGRVNKK